MIRRDMLSLGLLLTAGGLAATLPTAAGARPTTSPGLLARDVKGTYRSKGNGKGSLRADVLVQRLSVVRGKRALEVQGRIASPDGGTGGLAPFTSQRFASAAARLVGGGSGGGACGVLTLNVGTLDIDARGGLRIDPAPIDIATGRLTGRGERLAPRLCELGDLLDGDGSFDEIKDLLDRINDILADGLINLP